MWLKRCADWRYNDDVAGPLERRRGRRTMVTPVTSRSRHHHRHQLLMLMFTQPGITMILCFQLPDGTLTTGVVSSLTGRTQRPA